MRPLLFLLVIWVAASLWFPAHQWLLPDADYVARAFYAEVQSGDLGKHLGITAVRVLLGVIASVAVGLPIGLIIALIGRTAKPVLSTVDFFRSIPIAMLFPAFIVFFGIGEAARFAMILYLTVPALVMAFWPQVSDQGPESGRQQYLLVHRNRVSLTVRLSAVLWEALPPLITGIKYALSLAIVVVVVTEMFFSANDGVGYVTMQRYNAFQLQSMYVYVFVVGFFGYLANLAFDRSLQEALKPERR